jgi:hypothetical protein
MEPSATCQSCRRPASGTLQYRRGGHGFVCNETMLQCDICERFACAECLQVYNIFSGYDFLCHECARHMGATPTLRRGH